MSSNKIFEIDNTKKIIILFTLIFIFLMLLLSSIFRTVNDKKHVISLKAEKKELPVRGDIISDDNFKISTSKKLYRAEIDTRHIAPEKKELFLNLFSIYSGVDYSTLKIKLNEGEKTPGNNELARVLSLIGRSSS